MAGEMPARGCSAFRRGNARAKAASIQKIKEVHWQLK
jgi:hypothetical protein